MVKNGCSSKISGMNLKDEYMNWADFLHADSDAIIFSLLNILFCIFDFYFASFNTRGPLQLYLFSWNYSTSENQVQYV